MAIYYNLCIDCGTDAELADLLLSHFSDYELELDDRNVVRCESLRATERGIEFAGVEPVGMGHATLPEEFRRPELTDPDVVARIREILYRELKPFTGFRRAMFGAECWDQLVFATSDADLDIDYDWMISSIKHFADDPQDCAIERYNEGYRMIVGKDTEK